MTSARPDATAINKLLFRIATRAESSPPEILARTFVPVEQIANGLLRIDHQIVYGRRGTGKTHAFRNLGIQCDRQGDLAIYVDLRKIGSNGGLYSDTGQSVYNRATQLLVDILEVIHYEFLRRSVEQDEFAGVFSLCDALADAATEVRVEGPVTVETEADNSASVSDEAGSQANLSLGPGWQVAGATSRRRSRAKTSSQRARVERTGSELPRLLFGRLGKALDAIGSQVAPRRIWLLLDEWSSVPLDLQPYLADMLRRSVFPSASFTVKIGAIERRSRFIVRRDAATYIGLEPGADTAAALNLDEYLLANEDSARAKAFFAHLLTRHISVLAEDAGLQPFGDDPATYGAVVRMAFTDSAYSEFVRAAEGVPRDALNIVGLAAATAVSRQINTDDVQRAARKYFLQDKETGIAGNPGAQELWARLIREVVADRRSRTFLVRRNRDHIHAAILDLYDARLIHLLQSGLATPSRPGVGFDGYAIDYGSYIHMMRAEEEAAAWDARSRPWMFSSTGAYLPDRFDEGVIFTPAKARTTAGGRRGRT